MGQACSADPDTDDLDAPSPWLLCAADTPEEPMLIHTPELQPRPTCLKNSTPPPTPEKVTRITPLKLASKKLGYRQDKLIQRFLLPAIDLGQTGPVVNSARLLRELQRFGVSSDDLELSEDAEDVDWNEHLTVTVKPDGVELGTDEWRIDGVDSVGLLVLWLIAQQLQTVEIVVGWRNKRRDRCTMKELTALPGDPPQNQPNEQLEQEAFAANNLKEGFQWSSDWQLDLEWSQSGWRYAAEWTTEPDLWSMKDHGADTPLCRRKIFRVMMQRKDKEAAALEVSSARKQLVLKLVDEIMESKGTGFEELENTVIDLHNKQKQSERETKAADGAPTRRACVTFQRQIMFRAFEKATAPDTACVIDGTAACKLDSPKRLPFRN